METDRDDGQSQSREPAMIGDLLDSVIAGIGGGVMTPMLTVRRVWHEAAGPEWAERARPVGFDGSAVLVEVADGTAASLFRYEAKRIGAALTKALGTQKPLRLSVRVTRPDAGRARSE